MSFSDEIKEDLQKIRNSQIVIRSLNVYQTRVQPVLHSLRMLILSATGRFLSTRFNLLCTFAGALILIILLYFSMPVWLKVILACLLLLVGSLGRSFLDWRYTRLEAELSDQMLHNARMQATLGVIDEPVAPELPEAKALEELGTEHKIIVGAERLGVPLRFVQTDDSSQATRFIFYSETPNPKIAPEFGDYLKTALSLKTPPIVHSTGNLVYVNLMKS